MAERNPFTDRLQNALFRALLGGARLLPYRQRVAGMGWALSRVVAPLAGWRKRIRANLAHTCPDLPDAEVARLTRAVPDNVGRTLMEIYSGDDFVDRLEDTPITGPGLAVLDACAQAHKPVIIVSGHFANYDAMRGPLIRRGCDLGALYRPMSNPFFNAHYVRAISRIGTPLFPKGREGFGQLLTHLRGGGMVAILFDLYQRGGAPLDFFGQPAPTALTPADLALKFDAPLIPAFAIRRPDGFGFELVVEAPVPPGEPSEMMQDASARLEARIRDHMDQWFWIHRRWKPERQAQQAAARGDET